MKKHKLKTHHSHSSFLHAHGVHTCVSFLPPTVVVVVVVVIIIVVIIVVVIINDNIIVDAKAGAGYSDVDHCGEHEGDADVDHEGAQGEECEDAGVAAARVTTT